MIRKHRRDTKDNTLNKLHYIENFGTGIPRILDEYKNSERKPDFEPCENSFILKNYADPVTDPIYDELNDLELAIMIIISSVHFLSFYKLIR